MVNEDSTGNWRHNLFLVGNASPKHRRQRLADENPRGARTLGFGYSTRRMALMHASNHETEFPQELACRNPQLRHEEKTRAAGILKLDSRDLRSRCWRREEYDIRLLRQGSIYDLLRRWLWIIWLLA
jgi:hypothetical protein